MGIEIVFDHRISLDIIDDLIATSRKSGGIASKPSKLVILPDGISKYQLKSYILQKPKCDILNDLYITTFESLAGRITGISDVADVELLRYVVTAAVQELDDPISKKIQSVLSGDAEPEMNLAIEKLIQEFDEYSGFIDPVTLNQANLTQTIISNLDELEPLLVSRAEDNLEFFRLLMKKSEEILGTLGIPDIYLTRSHMNSEAITKMASLNLEDLLDSSPITEIYIIGIPLFDNTLIKLISKLILTARKVVFAVSPPIAERTQKRLEYYIQSIAEVIFKKEIQKKRTQKLERYSLPDRRREIEFAAAKCLDLLSSNISADNVQLISRLAPDYRPYFESIFNEFGLPSFMRTREALVFSPVYRFIESILSLLVKLDKKQNLSASDISQPLRLGFPIKKEYKGRTYRAAIDDRQFLAIETTLEQLERFEGTITLNSWIKRLNDKKQNSTTKQFFFIFEPVLQLLEWLETNGKVKPDVRKLISLLRRFIDVYGVTKDYPVLGLVSQTRFEISNEHISSQANRVLTGLYQLVRHQKRMSSARALIRNPNESTTWSDTLRAYRGLVGGTTYGKVQRDSDAYLFVDAGISHFIDAEYRFIIGLNNEQFPRKLADPFLLFAELRESLNIPDKGLFIMSSSTQQEIERYLFISAVGRADNVILTMNYLDERGHKQNWSVFADGDVTGEIHAHELRVELSQHLDSSVTSNITTVLFDYLRDIRNKKTVDPADDLSAILDVQSLPKKWGDEIETIATCVLAMRERVLEGKFDPMLSMGPKSMIDDVLNKDRIPSTWEIDLITYCPAMYYFYMFYHLLPYKTWIVEKENVPEPTRYIPAYKESFMGKTPLPIWRSQFSSRSTYWIESNIGNAKRELSDKERESLSEQIEILRVSPAEKNALKILLSKMSELPGGFKLKPAGLNSSKKFWRPFVVSQAGQGYRIIPYKLGPHANFPYTHLSKRRPYELQHCSESSRFYVKFEEKTYPINFDDAISALASTSNYTVFHTSRDFKETAWNKGLCNNCGYRSLCGIWGF